MHAVAAARIVESPLAAGALLMAVAAGMIGHSLRYRSQTVTGLAYFIGFVTIAIAEVNALAAPALIPLAVSLLYLARRFGWKRFALCGLIATYATIALRGESGAALWLAQSVLVIFWLVFEAFDIATEDSWLLPFNAIGFLGLSLLQWQDKAPGQLWQFLAAASVAYTISAILRARTGWWQPAATLAAGLGAAAIFAGMDHRWVALTLLIEAEAFYAAGLRLRAPYLRHLGGGLFAIQLGRLVVADLTALQPGEWVPVAALDAAVFYANRFRDRWYGYAGAAMLALIAGFEAPHDDRGLAWTILGAVAFAAGWRGRLSDLRIQGYALAALGVLGMAAATPEPRLSIAIGAALFYAAALCGRFSPADRFLEGEAEELRLAALLASAGMLVTLVWRSVPELYHGIAWLALSAILLEAGRRELPAEMRRLSLALAALGSIVVVYGNLASLANAGAWAPRLIPLGAAVLAYTIAARAPEALDVAPFAGTGFLAAALWAALPISAVPPAWAAVAAALAWAPGKRRSVEWQSSLLAAAAFVGSCGPAEPVPGVVAVVVLFYLARRMWYSLAGSLLLAILLYAHVSGSVLTVAWGAEGIALLAAGFPLRDRVLRLSGLGLLLFCILKAFVYDLRYLETLPRIFSFIVLGLILVSVSWLYARFRDRLQRLL